MEDEDQEAKNFENSELTMIENSVPNELTESASYLDLSK